MENNSSKWEKLLQKIQEFRLLDDDFMSRVFDENIECAELILRIGLFRKQGRLWVRGVPLRWPCLCTYKKNKSVS